MDSLPIIDGSEDCGIPWVENINAKTRRDVYTPRADLRGGGALLSTYWVPRPLVVWDLPWEALTGAILWVFLWFNKGKLGKKGALGLIALYVA